MASPISTLSTKAQSDAFDDEARVAFKKTLKTKRPLTGSQWAEQFFYLSPESSGQEGKFEALPYQVAMLDVMGADEPRIVDVQKCKRIGYTKCLDAIIGYNLEHKRRNTVIYQPTDGDAIEFCKSEIDPMVRDVPVLRGLAEASENKKRSDTLTMKQLGRKLLYILGGKAPGNFRRITADTIIYDELDGFDLTIGDSGDPLELGDGRITNASFPKSIRGSTPLASHSSLIAQEVARARLVFEYWVKCPECSASQPMRWGQFKFDKAPTIDERAATARYECGACGEAWLYRDIWKLLGSGVWCASEDVTGPIPNLTHSIKTGDADPVLLDAEGMPADWPRHVAFRIWAAYSPYSPWSEMVQHWLEAQGHPGKLKTFTNEVFGEVFEELGEKVDEHELFERRENYAMPNEILTVIASGDVQENRVEIEIAGFGIGEVCWHLDHRVVYGDTDKVDSPVWKDVNDIITTSTYKRDDGRVMRIEAFGLDTGYRTETCYRVLKKVIKHRRAFALKGIPGEGRAIVSTASKQKTVEGKPVSLFGVGVDTAKALVMARLSPQSLSPIRLNLSVTLEMCEQLTAERRMTKYVRGFARKIWVKTRDRNELLDLMGYLLATLYILNPAWPALATRAEPPKKTDEPLKPIETKARKFPKGWATRW